MHILFSERGHFLFTLAFSHFDYFDYVPNDMTVDLSDEPRNNSGLTFIIELTEDKQHGCMAKEQQEVNIKH